MSDDKGPPAGGQDQVTPQPATPASECQAGPRGKGIPYAWFDKRVASKIITDGSDSINRTAALTVYVALCIVASDKKADTFTASQHELGKAAGITSRTVQRFLPELIRLGVVEVSTPQFKVMSTYTLRPFDDQSPATPDGSRAMRQPGGTIRQSDVSTLRQLDRATCRTSLKNSPKERVLRIKKVKGAPCQAPPVLPDGNGGATSAPKAVHVDQAVNNWWKP
jgi:hypothetical protein